MTPYSDAARAYVDDQVNQVTSYFNEEQGYRYAANWFVGDFGPNLIPIGGFEKAGATVVTRVEAAIVRRIPALGMDLGEAFARLGTRLVDYAPKLNPANYSFNTGRLFSGVPWPEYVGPKLNWSPKHPYNISTEGMSVAERQSVTEYARRVNQWLQQNGPVNVTSTKGQLRSQSSAAARAERLRASRAGTPYQGQAGHIPDAALSGQAVPPGGWLDMPGKANSTAGGGLGPIIGEPVDVITIDGEIP